MQALTAMAPPHTRVLAVDTACQVPMQAVKCSTSKAYIFRSATQKPRQERMESMPYSDAGLIKHIAPYAPQGEGAAAGAEDHPDAEGVCSCCAVFHRQHHCYPGQACVTSVLVVAVGVRLEISKGAHEMSCAVCLSSGSIEL